jgi:hypothetical protein
MGTRALSAGEIRSWRKADLSLPPSVVIRDGGTVTHAENFAFEKYYFLGCYTM